ncbi:MAG TPA: hypothetical protein VFV10_06665, partial [Gammaproteobacteria bacterium]|nr:hypothetical protein [Gammaproteobacteria bacterium]
MVRVVERSFSAASARATLSESPRGLPDRPAIGCAAGHAAADLRESNGSFDDDVLGSPMENDTLSDVLRSVRLRSALYFYVSCGGRWAAEAPPSAAIAAAV